MCAREGLRATAKGNRERMCSATVQVEETGESKLPTHFSTVQHTATHCNTLQHTATHYNTLQHAATSCNTLQQTATRCNTLYRTATPCNTLQHTAAHCNTLPATHYLYTLAADESPGESEIALSQIGRMIRLLLK